ncbi:MAG: formylglycine-generating enzyme family protein [Thermoflexibacter sp.]|jgi:formylglycine-generating enzyme required for sulfatase activity|nr:formylglycine-generating enzyme family protein [Thermoflexibacter sp.]
MFTQNPITQNYSLSIEGEVIEMIKVAGGHYQIGREKNHPIIYLSDFWIGKFPVTQAFYKNIMGHNPSLYQGANRPVEQVNWNDCQAFISQLNELEEVKKHQILFRLPTEAEWEYAASDRGTANLEYAGSNELNAVGWYDENSPNQSKEVGLKKPNDLGIYDLNGNVWEWCEDDFDSNAFLKTPEKIANPLCINGQIISLDNSFILNKERMSSSSNKVNRGGSWRDGVRCCRLVNRDTYVAGLRLDIIGFRLASIFLA